MDDSGPRPMSDSRKDSKLSPFIKSTDSWQVVMEELKKCGWTEYFPGSFLKPDTSSKYLSEDEVKDYVKTKYGWGARPQRLHTKPTRIAECVSEVPPSALNATLPGYTSSPSNKITAEDDGGGTDDGEVGVVADGTTGIDNSSPYNVKINKFDDWATVYGKLDVVTVEAASSSSGYHYVLGKPLSMGGIEGIDFFQSQETLQDYCKRAYEWYGGQGRQQPREGRIVRLSPKGQQYVESTLDGLVAEYYAVWGYNPGSHSCSLVPIEKAGKFDANNNFDTNITGRDKWVCVPEEKCKGFVVDAKLIEVVVKADRLTSRNCEKQDDISCDEWNIKFVEKKDGKKRSLSSHRNRGQKAAKVSVSSSPKEGRSSPEEQGIATTSLPSKGSSLACVSVDDIHVDLVGGPRTLVEGVIKNQKEILPMLRRFSYDSSSVYEITVVYILSKFDSGDVTYQKIINDLKISNTTGVPSALRAIKSFGRDGGGATRHLNVNLREAIFKLRGQFRLPSQSEEGELDHESLRAESPESNTLDNRKPSTSKPDAEISIEPGENNSTPKIATGSTPHTVTPLAAAASPGSPDIATGLELEDDALACPITLELPTDPVIGVHGTIGTIYDRQALENFWDTQCKKGHDLTWPTTNEVINGKPVLISSPQLKNVTCLLSSRPNCNSVQDQLDAAEESHLEEQRKLTEELQQERAKRQEFLREKKQMRETIVRLEDGAKGVREQLTASRADVEKATKDNADLIADHQAKMSAFESEKAKAQSAIASGLEKKIALIEATNKILEENEVSLNERISSLSKRLEEKSEKEKDTPLSNAASEEISSLGTSLLHKDNTITSLISQMGRLSKELEKAKQSSGRGQNDASAITGDSKGEEAHLKATIRGLSAQYLRLETTAMKAIAASLGTSVDWELGVDVADLKGQFSKCKAANNFLCQLKVDWPSAKLPLVEMAKHLLDSLLRRHAANMEANIRPDFIARELAGKCRFIHLVLTNILQDSNWPETDNNHITLKMIIDHIPSPNSA